MCGICGYFFSAPPPGKPGTLLEPMIDALAHRGPDGRGLHVAEGAGLGHARLSIIDLETGGQPLFNEDRSVAVVCNGEIYNYSELQKGLRQTGHQFSTRSDCEVIAHLWEEHGTGCLEKLRGMFAFALVDFRKRCFFGARDRFGQKPFFYHLKGDDLSFASEIKALLSLPGVERRLNFRALDQFLFYRYVPHPNTLFEGIHQLPPGHFILRDGHGVTVQRYWTPPLSLPPTSGADEKEQLSRLKENIEDAVSCHMVSDVPIGIFLSGGIDSSLVSAIARAQAGQRLKSFSIGFPGHRYDESAYATAVSQAIGTEHHAFDFDPSLVKGRIEELIRHFDQPLADPAALPLSFLSQKAAGHVKVVLTGDGGDELFAGYEKYLSSRRHSRLVKAVDRFAPRLLSVQALAAVHRDPIQLRRLRARTALKFLPSRQGVYSKSAWEGWHRDRLYNEETKAKIGSGFMPVPAEPIPATSVLRAMLLVDQQAYLPDDLLLKTDYTTMAYGLESRAPLLDHLLAEAAAGLPETLLVRGHETKVALRKIAEAMGLPADITQRPKRGFSVPLKRWFRSELKPLVYDALMEHTTTVPLYFNRDAVRNLLDSHVSGRRNHTQKIYTLLVFELWHRQYMGG